MFTEIEKKQHRYVDFLKRKAIDSQTTGIEIDQSEINPILFPHQKDVVQWCVNGGNRGCFKSFGLGKTFVQIETTRIIQKYKGGKCLFVAPLGVRHQFTNLDAME